MPEEYGANVPQVSRYLDGAQWNHAESFTHNGLGSGVAKFPVRADKPGWRARYEHVDA